MLCDVQATVCSGDGNEPNTLSSEQHEDNEWLQSTRHGFYTKGYFEGLSLCIVQADVNRVQSSREGKPQQPRDLRV